MRFDRSTSSTCIGALLAAALVIQPKTALAQDDGDGIENALEVNGFTYDVIDGIQPWNGDPDVPDFVTNPPRWSTDEDPYSDFTETSGVNLYRLAAGEEVSSRIMTIIK